MDTEDLVHAALDGDLRARARLLQRVGEELTRLFARSFPDADAQDLSQITLMIIERKLPRFEPDAKRPFMSWVRAIARTQLKEDLRQLKRRMRLVREFAMIPERPQTRLSSRLRRIELLEIIEDELAKLDSRFRRAIEHHLAGGSDAELAEREGIKLTTVRTRRLRGLDKLGRNVRARLEDAPASTSSSS